MTILPTRATDLTGRVFGRIVVVKFSGKINKLGWSTKRALQESRTI